MAGAKADRCRRRGPAAADGATHGSERCGAPPGLLVPRSGSGSTCGAGRWVSVAGALLATRNYGGGATHQRWISGQNPARAWLGPRRASSGSILGTGRSSSGVLGGCGAAGRPVHGGAGALLRAEARRGDALGLRGGGASGMGDAGGSAGWFKKGRRGSWGGAPE